MVLKAVRAQGIRESRLLKQLGRLVRPSAGALEPEDTSHSLLLASGPRRLAYEVKSEADADPRLFFAPSGASKTLGICGVH